MIKKYKHFITEQYERNDEEFLKEVESKVLSTKLVNQELYVNDRISSLLFHNKLNKFDKRSKKIFDKKPFVRKEKDGYYGAFYILYSGDKTDIFHIILYESTTRNYGKFYFLFDNDGAVYIFKSHFFDRYYDRIFNNNNKTIPNMKNRDISIRDFLKDYVANGSVGINQGGRKRGDSFIFNLQKGAALCTLSKDERFLIFNTFISKNMFNKEEIDDIKTIDKIISTTPTLNYSTG